MELPKDDIPESIFLYLSFEYVSFSLPDSEPVSVSCYEFLAPPLPDPVSDIVPEHRTEYGTDDRHDEMSPSPESSYEDHHIHPWDCCADEGK